MKLKYRIPITIILVDIITAAILATISYFSQLQIINNLKSQQFEGVVNASHFVFDTRSSGAASRANLLANLPAVREGMAKKDGDQLYAFLEPTYKLQKELYGVDDIQIHVAPATLFLKLSNPARKGEDQSGFRAMILAVSREQSTQQGIEIGHSGVDIRAAAPIKDENGHYLGSLEIQMSFANAIRQIKTITGFEIAAFTNCEILREIATASPTPEPERQVGGQCNYEKNATDWDTTRKIITPELLRNIKADTFLSVNHAGISYGVVLQPTLDFQGRQIGVIVATRDMSEYQAQASQALINILALYLIQLILVIGALLVVFNGWLLRPLEALSHNVRALAEGESAADLSGLSKRSDEIGEMSKALDKLTEHLPGRKNGA